MIVTNLSVINNIMKILLLLVIIFISVSSQASKEVTEEELNGKWLIVLSGGINPQDFDLGDDYWVFKNHQLQVETSGKALPPDPYKIDGSNIVYGTKPYEVTIKVISISDSKLEVNTRGIMQTLEKVK